MEKENLPKHIAIIMDGNRRWAKSKNMPVSFGHKEGAKTLEKIVRYANKIGIKYITVYAFSTENWKRTTEEVTALMNLFQSYLDDYSKRADSENIKVKIIGNRQGLSEKMQKSIEKLIVVSTCLYFVKLIFWKSAAEPLHLDLLWAHYIHTLWICPVYFSDFLLFVKSC